MNCQWSLVILSTWVSWISFILFVCSLAFHWYPTRLYQNFLWVDTLFLFLSLLLLSHYIELLVLLLVILSKIYLQHIKTQDIFYLLILFSNKYLFHIVHIKIGSKNAKPKWAPWGTSSPVHSSPSYLATSNPCYKLNAEEETKDYDWKQKIGFGIKKSIGDFTRIFSMEMGRRGEQNPDYSGMSEKKKDQRTDSSLQKTCNKQKKGEK